MLRICFAIDTLDRHYRYLTSPSCAMKQMEIDAYDIKNYDENFIENKLVWYAFYDFDLEDEDLIQFFDKVCIKEGLRIIPVPVEATKLDEVVEVFKRFGQFLANHKEFEGKSICLGAFVDWDNTPRRAEHSTFFYGAKPSQFEKYMRLQIKNAEELDSPFIFINAWNEWGEGTYLEPDMKYGYGYLKALQRVMGEESDAE